MTSKDTPRLNDQLIEHAIRGGQQRDNGQAISQSPVFSSTFHLKGETNSAKDQYGRFDNPSWRSLEQQLTLLEGGEALIFPSGMAAVSAVFMSLLQSGDRLIMPSDGYYASRAFVENFLSPLGVELRVCSTLEMLQQDLNDVRMVFVESPSNPMLDVVDIQALADKANQANCLLVIDNTTLSPIGQQPLRLGADISVCSDTKSVNGHSDTLFGHIAVNDEQHYQRIRQWRTLSGAIPGPMETWLVQRGLATLDMRLERMTESAMILAENLQHHEHVRHVRYPGLPQDPSHQLAKMQQANFGSIVSFDLGSKVRAEQFLSNLNLVMEATSFGGLHSMAERRARWGTDNVAEGLIRLSLGCEPATLIWQDIEQALGRLD
ncbi:cystathionine gamma-lyase [Pleionea litopenaei]|uniref:Cystathionine gamma-lyase n=1 Tax=Pleionea litopenaei TaxID=3070815 RepID=A0AA51RX32_9GAMM|nr:cystathionine gamma-lyase [Pleionea sp. HL-JVS1]WMS89251.1 cystathionine gamma-lyase [Pleionea sp. HL-JVS1]